MGWNPDKCQSIDFPAMGTNVAVLANRTGKPRYWERPVKTWFAQFEKTASRFLPQSTLSQLNQLPPMQWVEVPGWFFELLHRAWDFALSTDYLFQPFIGSALLDWGYRQSFENMPDSLDRASNLHTYSTNDIPQFEFHAATRTVRRTTTHQVDLGGIGKGWAVQKTADLMRNHFQITTGCVDAGGDLYVWSDDKPWIIGIEDPRCEHNEITQLYVHQAAIATSQTKYRQWQVNGETVHHIFHGQTGLPVYSDIVQATVCGKETDEAEVASKIICMLGSSQAEPWMKHHFPHLGYLYVKTNGDVQVNRQFFQYVERCA